MLVPSLVVVIIGIVTVTNEATLFDWTFNINRVDYEPGVPFATMKMGEVQDFTITSQNEQHPYHQHVFPFQLMQPVGGPFSDHFSVGDFYDSVEGTSDTKIRFRPVRFGGHMVLHCHDIVHADMGMMGFVEIEN